MDKVKKIILFSIPLSICNFRCHYCYLAQRPVHYQGIQPEMKYSPEEIARAFSKERVGGAAFMNFCANGETLLLTDLDKYVKALVEQGHYAEIVTNCTVTPMLDKILSFPPELLERITFKCSFHYQELKKKNLLDRFADNIKKIWAAGASANIEITPSDELIPLIDEVKEFSMKHFGALPHLTIARNDRTDGIEYLTKLSDKEYEKVWSQFGSTFWEFKRSIFGKKQTGYCYAGAWGYYVDLSTGVAQQCYCGIKIGDVVAHPEKPLPFKPIGHCRIAHCYNGHALMTLGYIPNYDTKYGDIRDREKTDGSHWLQPGLKQFFNTQLIESNEELTSNQKRAYAISDFISRAKNAIEYRTYRLFHE